jgi:hypothetical protein
MNYEKLFNANTHLLEEPEVQELLKVCYYLYKRCELAEKIIEECPCDPDITKGQVEAWRKYEEFMEENNLNNII